MVSQEGNFTQILVDNDLYGYVSNDYIDEKVEFAEAISIEEERAKQEEEARKQREAEEAAEPPETGAGGSCPRRGSRS